VAEALQYAHDQKVVHRDIKPHNLLLGNHDEILLSDFGIAVTSHRTDSWVQQKILGTPFYMAPEQFRAHAVPASDQYSLAVIIYEWLSGKVPFTADAPSPQEQFLQLAYQHNEVPPPPLHEKVPTISGAVEEVVHKALAKDPQQRFGSMLAFAHALEQACQPKPPLGTPLLTYRGHCDRVYQAMWSPDGKSIASIGYGTTVQVWNATTGAIISTYPRHPEVPTFFPHKIYPERFDPDSIAWSPDGEYLFVWERAWGGFRGKLHMWRANTGGNAHIYGSQARVSPDGQYVAFPDDEDKFINFSANDLGSWPLSNWNVNIRETGKTIFTLHDIKGLTWLPGSKCIVLVNKQEQVLVCNIATKTTIVTYKGHSGRPLHWISFSPDGKYIASVEEDLTVKVWDTNTGATIFTWHDCVLSWPPDGKYIAQGSAEIVQVWNVDTRKNIITYWGHPSSVVAQEWSPNGTHIISVDIDGFVQVWNAISGTTIFTWHDDITWHDDRLEGAVWSPNGENIATRSKEAEVQVRNVISHTTMFTYRGHSAPLIALRWSPDGKYITSTSNDKEVRVWEATTGTTIFTWPGRPEVAWSPDGSHIAAGTEESGIHVLSPATRRANITYRGHLAPVGAVAWSPNSNHVASASHKVVQIWDAASGTTVATYRGHSARVKALNWSPNGKRIASAGDDGTVQVWNAATTEHIYTYHGHRTHVNAVTWSPDGLYIASAGDDGTMQVWNVISGENVFTCQEVSSIVTSLAWSLDGTRIAYGSSPNSIAKAGRLLDPPNLGVKVLDVVTSKNISPYSTFGIGFPINAVSWSPDGNKIVSAYSDSVLIWDIAAKAVFPSVIFDGHEAEGKIMYDTAYVTAVAWSPDGKYIASASRDGTAQVWDAITGKHVYIYRDGHTVNAVAWSPDGMRIATASFGVHIWQAK